MAVDATLPYAAYGKLLRLYARSNNASGAVCVRRMVKEGHRPCERLCRTVMLRCVESQNVALAEALAAFLRLRLRWRQRRRVVSGPFDALLHHAARPVGRPGEV